MGAGVGDRVGGRVGAGVGADVGALNCVGSYFGIGGSSPELVAPSIGSTGFGGLLDRLVSSAAKLPRNTKPNPQAADPATQPGVTCIFEAAIIDPRSSITEKRIITCVISSVVDRNDRRNGFWVLMGGMVFILVDIKY